MIRNLVVRHAPVYALGEWASRYEPSAVGLTADDLALLNDDRVGRMLARLFDADRASLLTRLVLDAAATFDIDLSRLHNDSTSIKLSGPTTRQLATPAAASQRLLFSLVSARIIALTCDNSCGS